MRSSILREGFEPGERVARGVGKRTKRQTFTESAIDLRLGKSAILSGPDRHVGPWFNFLLRQKFFADPGEIRIRFLSGLDFIEHSAEPERFGRAGGIVNSSLAILHHADRPFGQITGINELNGISWVSGREHFAAAIDPHRP